MSLSCKIGFHSWDGNKCSNCGKTMDPDGNINNLVKICDQEWMVKNLNISHFRNGDSIPEVKSDAEWIKAGEKGKPAWCYYDNNPENGKKYGKLYNWFAVSDPRGLAPAGYEIPTSDEHKKLMIAVKADANSLKAEGQGNGSGTGTNGSGFSAMLAGYRGSSSGSFYYLENSSYFWSSSEDFTSSAYYMYLYYNSSNVYLGSYGKTYGFSVRCIKK